MTSPIDPFRRTSRTRRTDRTPETALRPMGEVEDRGHDARFNPATDAHAPSGPDGATGFTAQMLGQDGHAPARNAAPAILDAAKTAYVTIQWSGPLDRRARKGAMTKTDL